MTMIKGKRRKQQHLNASGITQVSLFVRLVTIQAYPAIQTLAFGFIIVVSSRLYQLHVNTYSTAFRCSDVNYHGLICLISHFEGSCWIPRIAKFELSAVVLFVALITEKFSLLDGIC